MSYQSALFCQYFAEELRAAGGTLRGRIGRAMRRLSPTLKRTELRIYTAALLDTVAPNGTLRPDWRERVGREH